MRMTSVVCNVPVLSQNDSTYHHSVFTTWKLWRSATRRWILLTYATQKAWSTIEKEAYAAIWALQKFRNWIFGQPTTVIYSDHNPLTYITESSTKSAKLMRWLLSLQSYNVTFKYKEGRKNVVADCLSRLDSATEWRCPKWRKFLQISCMYIML